MRSVAEATGSDLSVAVVGGAGLGGTVRHEEPDVIVLIDGWIDDPAAVLRRAGADGPPTAGAAVAAAWRRFGPGFVESIDGEYAIAVWERGTSRLVLWTDPVGTRPIYVTRDAGRVAFSTHLPALLRLPWSTRELRRDLLAEYLSFGTVHAPRTLVRGVDQLVPGDGLSVSDEDDRPLRRVPIPYSPPDAPSPWVGDVVDAVQEAVTRAVRRRTPPGSRRGLYLSGGLGSTVIAAAAKSLGRDLPTFTVGVSDDPYPESPFAGRIARLLGQHHHAVFADTGVLASAFDQVVSAVGAPTADPTALLMQILARESAGHADVVLSGDGSEELFGGPMVEPLGRPLLAARVQRALPGVVRRGLRPLLSRLPGADAEADPTSFGLERGLGGLDLFDRTARQDLFVDPGLVRPDVRRDTLAPFYREVSTDPVNAVLHAWVRSRLAHVSVPRTAATARAVGLDARFPLLDREVVTMAAALPGRLKVETNPASLRRRWPLQAMVQAAVPPTLLNRPKRSVPLLGEWLAGHGRLFLEQRVASLRDAHHGLFRDEALASLRARVAHEPDVAPRLWALFFLQAWLDANGVR